ncbi:hypothetical protein HJG60_009899 [Phyllostomus discolor]|uniref:Uncharacterized protein n=1 Tax=Phyllostomus discolor TaxID=89673 RepID=A0A834B9V5_9CHIR|nr:hypothetical protein HJG60_009899 [Phyllostomus discolor]
MLYTGRNTLISLVGCEHKTFSGVISSLTIIVYMCQTCAHNTVTRIYNSTFNTKWEEAQKEGLINSRFFIESLYVCKKLNNCILIFSLIIINPYSKMHLRNPSKINKIKIEMSKLGTVLFFCRQLHSSYLPSHTCH